MSWFPQFTAPQWVMMMYLLVPIVYHFWNALFSRDDSNQSNNHTRLFGVRIIRGFILVCCLGWAGFWS
jgi:hypothetical protein